MVDCFRKSECSVKAEGACQARFISDHCPNSQLKGNEIETIPQQPNGAMSDEEPE